MKEFPIQLLFIVLIMVNTIIGVIIIANLYTYSWVSDSAGRVVIQKILDRLNKNTNVTQSALGEIVRLEQILLQDRALMFKNSDIQDHKRLVQINQTQYEILGNLTKK